MIQHVWQRGVESGAREVVVATDDERIAEAAESFGANVCMTASTHASGTDRIAEVADVFDWDDDAVVVNLQGDEPLMPPQLLRECAALLEDEQAQLATLASSLADRAVFEDPNVVKVITDERGFALYFSRAGIPHPRDDASSSLALDTARQHHGIYAYRCRELRRLVAARPSALEQCERLEQLRALSLGMRIKVGVPSVQPSPGVDTAADVERVERELEGLT